jgi:rhomboid protease GluP
MDNQPSAPSPNNFTQRRPAVVVANRRPYVTYILLAIIMLLYINAANFTTEQRALFLLDWAKINSRIYAGEYYRLLSSMFIHLDLEHFLLNGFALYIFGREVERLYGRGRFMIIYFFGGLTGSVASVLYTEAVSIGASGALFAILGASGVFWYHHREVFALQANDRIPRLLFYGGISIAYGFIPNARIDNAAHIGGLLGGFVLAWFMSPAFEIKLENNTARLVDHNRLEHWVMVPIAYGIALVMCVMLLTLRFG